MANLFWNDKKRTLNLLSKDFATEEEFEELIMSNNELLGDIFLISRQARGGKKKGIPDIIGSDKDGNVCIIEMKNVKVTSEIIPQVLRYAIWAQENPAEIENLWVKSDKQPEEYQINFDGYDVRILIIAPEIDPSTAAAIKKLNYDVELIEIKRWADKNNEFFLVNKIESPETKKITQIRGHGDYTEQEYNEHHNNTSVKRFMTLSQQLKKISNKKNWPLELKYNKNYCGLKYGHYLVAGINWWGSKTFRLFVMVPEKIAKKFEPKGAKYYGDSDKTTSYELDGVTSLEKYTPLFQKALDLLKEKRG